MHLVYLDDSSDHSDVQVMAVVIVPDTDVLVIEKFLGIRVEMFVPEEIRPKFEFHAFKLWKREDEFSAMKHEQVQEVFEGATSVVEQSGIEVVYGAVNLRALRSGYYSTAQPIDIAFRLCMEGVRNWFRRIQPLSDLGILISDEMKPNIKKDMQQAYRAFRDKSKLDNPAEKQVNQISDYLHDDLYFGDSAYSVGLQLADMCAFLIRHHLQQKGETDYLYKRIAPKIIFGKIEPKPSVSLSPSEAIG